MKILYIGQLNDGGTCLDRLRSLERLGNEVVGFDVSPFQSRFRLLRSAQWRIQPELLLRDLNNSLIARTATRGEFDLVWIDKGVWIFPDTVAQLRANCGNRAVHFTPDPQIQSNRSRHFLKSMPLYDLMITTKVFEVSEYRAAGAKSVLLSTQSYCPVRYRDPKPRAQFLAEVGFIGHYERHYGVQVSAVAADHSIRIWGRRWAIARHLSGIAPHVVQGDGLWRADYVDALASFKIGLGLLSKYIPEQHTTRSFEIPAAGTFLLAERTEEHLGLFEEGREAEFFGSQEELVSKVRFYLANEVSRKRIAESGRKRCHRSGYDTDSVLSAVMKEIR